MCNKGCWMSITEALKLRQSTYINSYIVCDNFGKRSVSNYKFFFVLWVTFLWNSLPREVVKLCTKPLANELYEVFEGSSENKSEKNGGMDMMT